MAEFNPDEYLAEFDPDKYLASQPKQMSAYEAAPRGIVDMASFGFADEVGGAMASPMGAIKEMGKYVGMPPDRTSEDVKAYIKARDVQRAANAQAAKEQPYAYYGGEVAGALAMPMGLVGKGATMGARALRAAVAGGVGGMGASTAEKPVEQAKDVAIGGTIGGVMGPVAEKIAGRVKPAALRESAENWAVRHLRPTPKLAYDLGPEQLRGIGREALNSGAIGFGQKAEQTALRLESLLEEVGAVKGDIVAAAQGGIDPAIIADRVQKQVIYPLRKTGAGQKYADAIQKELDTFMNVYQPAGPPVVGRPTTITRKSEFIPQEPGIDFQSGLQKIGETKKPKIFTEAVTEEIPGVYQPEQRQSLRIFNTGDDVSNVNAYITPEASVPFKTDPKTGLPIKQMSEKRIEGVAEIPPSRMSPMQLENEKMKVQGDINYLNDTSNLIDAKKQYASVLRQGAEELIPDPNFIPAKRAWGNLEAAKGMADRTAALTNGGTGLVGSLQDMGATDIAAREFLHGNPLGLAAPVARGVTKGKIASSMAVGLDKSANKLESILEKLSRIPGAQKFAGAIQSAATRGPGAVAATHFLLQQTDPEYSQMMQDSDE